VQEILAPAQQTTPTESLKIIKSLSARLMLVPERTMEEQQQYLLQTETPVQHTLFLHPDLNRLQGFLSSGSPKQQVTGWHKGQHQPHMLHIPQPHKGRLEIQRNGD